jgi:hypothetical protein
MAQVAFSGFPTSKHVTQETTDPATWANLARVWGWPVLEAKFDRKGMFLFSFSETRDRIS